MQESDSLSAVWRSYRSWRLGGHTRCRGRAGSPELMHSIHIQHAKFSDPGEAMTGSPYRLPRYCFPTIQRRQPSQLCVRFRGSITSTSRLSAYCLAILRLTLSITRHSPRTRYRWFGSDLTGRASHPLWTAPFARRTSSTRIASQLPCLTEPDLPNSGIRLFITSFTLYSQCEVFVRRYSHKFAVWAILPFQGIG